MELKYSTGLKRIGAAIVDNLVFLPLTFLSEKLYALELPREGLMAWNYVFVVLPVAYSIICHYKYGMTIGKYVAKIKVIDVSETKNMNLRQAFLRDIFLVIFIAGTVVVRTDVFERSKLISESFNNDVLKT